MTQQKYIIDENYAIAIDGIRTASKTDYYGNTYGLSVTYRGYTFTGSYKYEKDRDETFGRLCAALDARNKPREKAKESTP